MVEFGLKVLGESDEIVPKDRYHPKLLGDDLIDYPLIFLLIYMWESFVSLNHVSKCTIVLICEERQESVDKPNLRTNKMGRQCAHFIQGSYSETLLRCMKNITCFCVLMG